MDSAEVFVAPLISSSTLFRHQQLTSKQEALFPVPHQPLLFS